MAIARRILVGLAWLYVLGIAVQFLLVGLGLLGGESLEAHEVFGYAVLYLYPLLMVVAARVARVPRTLLIFVILLALVVLVEPLWVTEFRGEFLGSLHVLGALVIFALAHAVAQQAMRLVRAEAA